MTLKSKSQARESKPPTRRSKPLSFARSVLLTSITVSAVFVAIPRSFYDPIAKDVSHIHTAVIGFALLVVAACFVDVKSYTLRVPTVAVVHRALGILVGVVLLALTINAKIRFRLSTLEDEHFETCLSQLSGADLRYFQTAERRKTCYGNWYLKIREGGGCKCPVK